MAGRGLIGGILSSLGDSKEPDLRSKPLNPQASPLYTQLFQDYAAGGKSSAADLAKFRSDYNALTPQLSALDQQHASLYGDLLTQAKNYNPGTLQGTGDYLYSKLDNYLKQGIDYGRANMNRSLAFAGYGDRSPSAYSTILDSSRIAGNMAPLFQGITNVLPYLNQQNQNAYFQNQALIPAYMQGQTNTLQNTAYRNLVPMQEEQRNLMNRVDQLNKINAGDLSNSYFYVKPNALQRAGGAMTAAYEGIGDFADTVNKLSSAYGNLMTGGLGGQMGLGKQGMGAEAPYAGVPNTGTPEGPGEGTGENYPLPQSPQPQSASAYGYQYPQGGAYGNYGVSYSQYNPNSLYSQFYANQSPYF